MHEIEVRGDDGAQVLELAITVFVLAAYDTTLVQHRPVVLGDGSQLKRRCVQVGFPLDFQAAFNHNACSLAEHLPCPRKHRSFSDLIILYVATYMELTYIQGPRHP